MKKSYEILAITIGNERSVQLCGDQDSAFATCTDMWAARKAGGPVYVVRNCSTDERWSFADIKDLVRSRDVNKAVA